MPSPNEKEETALPSNFIRCVEKLSSSVSTLRKHLDVLLKSVNKSESVDETTAKVQAIKDAITSLEPAIGSAKQLASGSLIVERLKTDYERLCEDFKKYFSIIMSETKSFIEYKQHIEHLSSWLSTTNANIHEVLQSVNKQRAMLIIKNLDELSKYKALLERATVLNRSMTADLPDEQAATMSNEIADVNEQWKILIDGLNTLKERHSSRYNSPEPNRLARQNENLINYIQSWINLGKELIKQEEQMTMSKISMIDETKIDDDSLLSNDNNQRHNDLLHQLRECEEEINRLKNLLEENSRAGNHNQIPNSEVTRSLTDQLSEIGKSLTASRLHAENRFEQQRGFILELDSLINWLTDFISHSSSVDRQTIQLALNERQHHFDELLKCQFFHNQKTKEKIEHLVQMWLKLSSMVNDSSTSVLTSNLTSKETISKFIDQANFLLNIIVQLANRQGIERYHKQLQTFLNEHNDSDQKQNSLDVKSNLPKQIFEQLIDRQLFIERMLIDTSKIEQLRVNFVAHFSTDNDVIEATNQIQSIIDSYPRESTVEIRQWLNEQQTSRLTAPLATIDTSKSIDDFQDYLTELESNLKRFEQNPKSDLKFQKLLEQIEQRPRLPADLNHDDRHRVESLEQRFIQAQKHVEQIQKSEVDRTIEHVDSLIDRLKIVEDQIRANAVQPLSNYESLIADCQRIIVDLDQNFRQTVEQTIIAGKRLYSADNRDSSGVESADETGSTTLIGSTTSAGSIKKHSDLALRKVRRHVLQLNQRWKTVNTNIRHRLKILQRAQASVDELGRKCDQIERNLVDIELRHAHQVSIRTLTVEQVPAEIEQAKLLLNTLMSYKTPIDDIQQSSLALEHEYEIQMNSRSDEIQKRWENSISNVSQRIQQLQESVQNGEFEVFSSSIEPPWQRAVAFNKVPYFINHSDQTTTWDHPKMIELMRSLSNLNEIRFSAYRTAMKLRALQKRLSLDLTSLSDIIAVFEDQPTLEANDRTIEKYVDVSEILNYLQLIFEKTANEYPQMINVILMIDLTLNWLLNIYDVNRTGTIRLLAMKMALALLCRGNIEEKYRYIFSLCAYTSAEHDQRVVLDRTRLSVLFQQAIVIPKQLGEVAAFGGSNVEPSVKSCFDYAHNPDVITAEEFLEWVKLEPQSLVWLPVMHRLAASEAAKHEARCNICKIYPIEGFRYRSLKRFNFDICQNCFFSGKQTKFFRMDDPLQEYYTETTSSEDIRDFFRVFKNKFCSRSRKNPKLGYLPLPHVFDNNPTGNLQSNSPSPVLVPVLTSTQKNETFSTTQTETTDEHGLIAQHCRNLNTLGHTSPRAAAHEILTRSRSLDNEQRNELEAIIRDLEDENRLLQGEYERLCQQHVEKSVRINEHFRTSDSHLGSLSMLSDYNSVDREMLREAKQLRHHKSKLEQRMKILEEHNKQLERQLRRSKQLLLRDSPALNHHNSSISVIEPRIGARVSSPLHSSTTILRRSVDRNLERQPNLVTIDSLFHMADDINRAVGDLVSVITEPQVNLPTTTFYKDLDGALTS